MNSTISSPVSCVPLITDAQLPSNACRRLFILGSGRSGTSLLAGLFRQTGLFMGASAYLASPSNPTGYYEDREINSINEELVRSELPKYTLTNDLYSNGWDCPSSYGQCWLARLPLAASFSTSAEINKRIDQIFSRGPTCLKDPRLNYTLQAWLSRIEVSQMNSMACICIFRHPSVVVESILREVRTAAYLRSFAISVKQAYDCWLLQYSHILRLHANSGRWLFVEYDELLQDSGLYKVEQFTGLQVDRTLPRSDLNRSKPSSTAPQNAVDIYQELMSRSSSS
jgi:hypothetical protein